ncbi:MAG: exodeoxyribonuclease V subunit alpha [Wenzhouxiangella sp.]|nr:exodeoxyribonuclease V subunit alpha [Wenzhouxiangella sp.]
MQPERVSEYFKRWQRLGWMRPLESRFVAFLADLEPDADGRVLLAAGLASHALAQGHVCLDIPALVQDPARWLGLPPDDTDLRLADDIDEAEWRSAQAFFRDELASLDADDWAKALSASRLVAAGEGNTPLVLEDGRLYLRRNWAAGREVLQALSQRGQALSLPLDQPALRGLFAQLFTTSDAEQSAASGPDWQKLACAIALRYGFAIITGGPGTGKTWTMVKLLALLQAVNQAGGSERPLRVLLAAPTGKAAARMTESVRANWQSLPEAFQREDWRPEEARTLHRLLGSRPGSRHFRHQRHNPVQADVVIVDEASMIDLQMMQALMRGLDPHSRLVLLGDKDQLSSVEPGAVFGDLCRGAERIGFDAELADWLEAASGEQVERADATEASPLAEQTVMLRQARRFNADIAALAVAVNAGEGERAAELLDQRAPVLTRLQPASADDAQLREMFVDQGYARYLKQLHQADWLTSETPAAIADAAVQPEKIAAWAHAALDAFGRFQILTGTRSGAWGVDEINRRVRRWLAEDGLVKVNGSWFHGRPVMISRNDYRTGLMNGDVGLCLAWPQADGRCRLRVVFQKADGHLHHYATTRISDCETAFAMTVHKSQGSEFNHTVLVLPDRSSLVLVRELIYTGLTRARDRFTLVAPNPAVLAEAIAQRTERSTILSTASINY